MRLHVLRWAVLGLSLAGAACATDSGTNDELASVVGDLTVSGIEEGSPVARGVLRVANEASQELLDKTVGLGASVAKAVVAHRTGPLGPTIDTLTELDDIQFVGALAFTKLATYAKANGFVVVIVPADMVDRTLRLHFSCVGSITDTKKSNPTGEDSRKVTLINDDYPGSAFIKTSVGGKREVSAQQQFGALTCQPDVEGRCSTAVTLSERGLVLEMTTSTTSGGLVNGCCGVTPPGGSCNPEYCIWQYRYTNITCKGAVDFEEVGPMWLPEATLGKISPFDVECQGLETQWTRDATGTHSTETVVDTDDIGWASPSLTAFGEYSLKIDPGMGNVTSCLVDAAGACDADTVSGLQRQISHVELAGGELLLSTLHEERDERIVQGCCGDAYTPAGPGCSPEFCKWKGYAKTYACEGVLDLTIPPPTWTYCASEGNLCAFTGRRLVRYGAGTRWVYRVVADGVACRNAVFGDPAPYYGKNCELI